MDKKENLFPSEKNNREKEMLKYIAIKISTHASR